MYSRLELRNLDKQRIMELAQELASVPDNDTGYAKHYILEDIENELNEKLEDKNMRILKGYSKEERKELEEAKDNGFLSVIALFCSIKRDDNNCHVLYAKYYREDTNGNNQMARDIADYYTGNAKFLEQKYVLETTTPQSLAHTYIKGISGSTYGGIGAADEIKTTSNKEEALVLSKNTIEQKLGGKYMAFAVPVEDDDE